MSQVVQVVTTTSTKDEAERIAKLLVERRLASCVQIAGPVTSVYRWKGRLEQAEEWTCTLKTLESLVSQVESSLCSEHSYEVPEFLISRVTGGSADYLRWIQEELTP